MACFLHWAFLGPQSGSQWMQCNSCNFKWTLRAFKSEIKSDLNCNENNEWMLLNFLCRPIDLTLLLHTSLHACQCCTVLFCAVLCYAMLCCSTFFLGLTSSLLQTSLHTCEYCSTFFRLFHRRTLLYAYDYHLTSFGPLAVTWIYYQLTVF